MMIKRTIAAACLVIGVVACAGLSGCNTVGPFSITEGRLRYNDVIAQTAQKQLLLNLIRVSHNQSPVFIDVTEVDASLTFSGALSGSEAGIGIGQHSQTTTGAFRTGTITSGTLNAGVGYAESPTIRYIPLQGQALVQQLSAPISVDSLPALFDSDVPLPTLIDFTVDRLTPGYFDYGAALNIIGQLDWQTAITVATMAPHSESAAGEAHQNGTVIVQTMPPVIPPKSALAIYLQPYSLACHDTVFVGRLWAQLLGLYATVRTEEENANRAALEGLLNRIQGCEGNRLLIRGSGGSAPMQVLLEALQKVPSIELRTLPLKVSGEAGGSGRIENPAPFLRMRSAYGLLRSIEVSDYNPAGLIEVVSPEDQVTIAAMPWNAGQQFHLFTYQQYCKPGAEISAPKCRQLREIYEMLSPAAREAMDRRICERGAYIKDLALSRPADERVRNESLRWDRICGQYTFVRHGPGDATQAQSPLLTMGEDDTMRASTLSDERRAEERLLHLQRRYILVVAAPRMPADTFVSVDVDGVDYYIARDDVISQRNFRFLALISSIQAVTPAPPLTPTLGVGGH